MDESTSPRSSPVNVHRRLQYDDDVATCSSTERTVGVELDDRRSEERQPNRARGVRSQDKGVPATAGAQPREWQPDALSPPSSIVDMDEKYFISDDDNLWATGESSADVATAAASLVALSSPPPPLSASPVARLGVRSASVGGSVQHATPPSAHLVQRTQVVNRRDVVPQPGRSMAELEAERRSVELDV